MLVDRRKLVLGVALWVSIGLGRPAGGQDISGSISGRVVDEHDQALPGATVTLVDERTGLARSGVTDAAGAFQFNAVAPGTYSYRVELPNFRTVAGKGVVLSASDRMSLGPLKLNVGRGESIVVEASGTRVNAEDSQHSGLLTATQIEQIQTKGRDVVTLLRLLPGVRYEDDIESLGESFGSQLPNMGGQRRQWNHVSVDGVMGNEIGGANRVAQAVNLDAIDEVKVLLNTYRAEFGRGGGAYVQIVTKGGTNRYQGSAYYYGRNEALNANNFFNNLNDRPRPRYRYNTFGFRFGGPLQIPGVWRPSDSKLFFFYSIEAPITETPGAFRSFRVPTERERNGDFSQTFDTNGQLIVIRDPVTRLPFPGNVIPPDRISRNGQALLNLLPLPNQLDRGITGGNFNFNRQETAEKPKMNNILRLDWKPSVRDTVSVSLKDWYSDQRGSEITVGPAKWGFFNAHYKSTDRTLAVSHTHLFSGRLVNEASAGVRRQTEAFNPVSEADYRRLRRSDVGYALGQFHPELNPQGIIGEQEVLQVRDFAEDVGLVEPVGVLEDERAPLGEGGAGAGAPHLGGALELVEVAAHDRYHAGGARALADRAPRAERGCDAAVDEIRGGRGAGQHLGARRLSARRRPRQHRPVGKAHRRVHRQRVEVHVGLGLGDEKWVERLRQRGEALGDVRRGEAEVQRGHVAAGAGAAVAAECLLHEQAPPRLDLLGGRQRLRGDRGRYGQHGEGAHPARDCNHQRPPEKPPAAFHWARQTTENDRGPEAPSSFEPPAG